MKDVMYLYDLGYTAIAPNGESHKIPQNAIDILNKNFKYIIVFYDKDIAGLKGTKKLLKENPNFGFIVTDNCRTKDITDYHKSFGKEKTKAMLLKKLNYSYKHHFKNETALFKH